MSKIKCKIVNMGGEPVEVYCSKQDFNNCDEELWSIAEKYDPYSNSKGIHPVPMAPPVFKKLLGISISKSELKDFKEDNDIKNLLEIIEEIETILPDKEKASKIEKDLV